MSLANLITQIARAGRREKAEGPAPHWYPSSMGKCPRAVVLSHAGVEGNPIDDETARLFWIGDQFHASVQKSVGEQLPGLVYHEVRLRDEEYKVSGRIDTLRYDPESGEWEVYEYKTVRTRAFEYALPQPAHILQVAIYLTFRADCPECYDQPVDYLSGVCGTCGNAKVKKLPLPVRARIVYVGKEDGRLAEFVVETSQGLQDAVKAKLVELESLYQHYLSDGTLPPPLPKQPLMVKGVPQVYVKTGKWGKAGDPKMVPDYRTMWCEYRGTGRCCGDDPSTGSKDQQPQESSSV